jgi:hypothetical protein
MVPINILMIPVWSKNGNREPGGLSIIPCSNKKMTIALLINIVMVRRMKIMPVLSSTIFAGNLNSFFIVYPP